MLAEKMYVRCPVDLSSKTDPRDFICGQIIKVDEFARTYKVKIHDPFGYSIFFPDIPKGILEFPVGTVIHCAMFIDSDVVYNNEICKVVCRKIGKNNFYEYYIQSNNNKEFYKVTEKDIIVPFVNGQVDPATQLRKYEFQNPVWYLGQSVVSRSYNLLTNSIFGFKELAGAKIYLLPHQVNTIMRCLQSEKCRYILADEVGMGKTIEAIAILKIFLSNNSNKRVLIIVPETLRKQWEMELLFKFDIVLGKNINNNIVSLKVFDDVSYFSFMTEWDFLVVDEVHNYLDDEERYDSIHSISLMSDNVLLLSATPVQENAQQYLHLLRLLDPNKYDEYTEELFTQLTEKQTKIVRNAAIILGDLEAYEEVIADTKSEGDDPKNSDECEELFDTLQEELDDIVDLIKDNNIDEMKNKIVFDADDYGVYQIKLLLAYVCGNYQIENKVIRNRRSLIDNEGYGNKKLLPTRKLNALNYEVNRDNNIMEALCYEKIADWIQDNVDDLNVKDYIRPLLQAFFSSPAAFLAKIKDDKYNKTDLYEDILENASMWAKYENDIVTNINSILDNPDDFTKEFNTRIVTILNYVNEELYNSKVVLFTNYIETFNQYKMALEKIYSPEEITFFSAEMESDEIELNVYEFQENAKCRVMLCDMTACEGRNFQCADYLVHIDIPWDVNEIEQRIGRLDRLERDPERDEVNSIVVYARDTFEEALFKFWNEGLEIFTQSLSGMEIVMKDINQEIVKGIDNYFPTGLFNRIPAIVQLATKMREKVIIQQSYDVAGIIFRPMYSKLQDIVNFYNNNENVLFADTMVSWASLAGFRGYRDDTNPDNVIYTAKSFSVGSAENSLLIPPVWNKYLSGARNKFMETVQKNYDKTHSIQKVDRSIKGTFIRKNAIENDYLHFFSPGDDVFDCIVNNAIKSCKGRVAAFAVSANINWRGIVFVWSISPNEMYLMDQGISKYAINPYRHFLTSEQITVCVSLDNPNDLKDNEILKEYRHLINDRATRNRIVHLGKRSFNMKFLGSIVYKKYSSNIGWFRTKYNKEAWEDIVKDARKEAFNKALRKIAVLSDTRGIEVEMDNLLSATMATKGYFNLEDDVTKKMRTEQEHILKAFRSPNLQLESAAYIWMVK